MRYRVADATVKTNAKNLLPNMFHQPIDDNKIIFDKTRKRFETAFFKHVSINNSVTLTSYALFLIFQSNFKRLQSYF